MIFRIILSMLMLISVAGCKGPGQLEEQGFVSKGSGNAMLARAMPASVGAEAPEAAPPPAPSGTPAQSPDVVERKIMRSANLTVEVKNIDDAAERAKSIAVKIGGFVSGSDSYEDNAGQKAMQLTMRVPSDRLDSAIAAIKTFGNVRAEALTGEDITEQYFDLEARLANSRRLESRLISLLETKTNKLKDVLDVERELARVRESIETMEGRKRFWDNRVSLSTLQVTLVQPRGFGRGIFAPLSGSIQRALSAFTASLAWLVVAVSAALPWLVLFFLTGWGGLKLLRTWIRHKREAKHKKAQKSE
ncbi:MAG: DUF4349 domain-containing protein [bacterium]